MVKEIYGNKVGMTQIFDKDGKVIPVTAIEVKPCSIVAIKTAEKEGYNAIVVSFGDVKEKNVNKPIKGIFTKAKVNVQKHLREIKVDSLDGFEVGKTVDLTAFAEGEKVDIQATSKGKGFQGTIKRHGMHRGPMAHGSMYHRRPGSMGATSTPGRVFKGKKLPGHMGSRTSTILNLDVVKVDTDKQVILVKGSIPGAKKAIVRIRKAVR